MRQEISSVVKARLIDGVLVESHVFPPDEPLILPAHAHEEYQIGLSVTENGCYRYRGASLPVPRRSVRVIHPGEVHSGAVRERRSHDAIFHSIYVPVDIMGCALSSDRGAGPALFVADPVLVEEEAFQAVLGLHKSLMQPGSDLAKEVRTLSALRGLLTRMGAWHDEDRAADHDGVRLARDLLHEAVADEISLTTLAALAGLSPWHFCRVFARRYGMPPHRYQLQLRVMRAKTLLSQGVPIDEVARRLGFHDRSHFARHFRAFTFVSPGRYGRP